MTARNLTGSRFGCFLVEEQATRHRNGSLMWWVRCDCGARSAVIACNLRTTTRYGKKADSGCLEWNGTRNGAGYGKVKWRKKTWSVHRLSAHLNLGLSPDSKLCVCHKCDNPPCFSPEHLFIGTHSDNTRDSVLKKRQKEAKKTHCPKGHPYSGDNLVMDQGKRKCRECVRERNKVRLVIHGDRYRENRRNAAKAKSSSLLASS